MKSSYDKRKPVKDNPRQPKDTNGGIGPSPFSKKPRDGTMANKGKGAGPTGHNSGHGY